MSIKKIPDTYIGKKEAEKEAEEIQHLITNRRRITEPVKTTTQDYQEAYEKIERDKSGVERGETETKEIQELFDMVLFDWDGVLYDSMENVAKGAVEVCKNFGVEINEKKFLETYDQPYQEWYKRLGIPADNENCHQYIRYLYHNEIIPKLRDGKKDDLFSDVIETIQELKRRNLKLGIVSSERLENIEKVLNKKNIRNLLDYVVARADNKTESIKRLCEENNFNLDRVLMIGDLPSDLRDARKAAIKVAGLARFEGEDDRLGSHDPDYLFKGLGSEINRIKPYVDKQKN